MYKLYFSYLKINKFYRIIIMFSVSEGGKWIPLDEYYYSRQEGDPMYREEKGKFRFKVS